MGEANKTNNYTEFYYHFFRNILLIAAPLLVISALVLSLPHSSAADNSSSDYVSINLPSSCTLVASGTNSHITNMISGQLKENIGSTEINTLCNDKNGYVVYTKGITQNGSNEPVLSSPIGPSYDIKTGNIPSTNSNSSWALKLNPVVNDYSPTVVDTYNNKYAPVPSDWTKVVSRSSGTSTNTDISDNVKSAFTTTYAVYTTPSQPAGTYSGQVKFILLHPSTADKISPDINTAFYNANKSTVSVLDPETGEYGNFYKMQDMDSGICGSVIQDGDITTAKLVDIRDNNLYYVTKLKDGNCWMTQNLALDLETVPTDVAPLTSENTDLNDNSLSGAYELGYTYENNVLTWKPVNATKSFTGNSVSGWGNSYTIPYSARKTDGTLTGHIATGNYYNWTAAIAANSSVSLTGNTLSDITNNPKNSICPKGWRLPTISNQSVAISGSTNEFARLNYLYNNNSQTSDANLLILPIWLVKSGFVGGENTYLSYYGSRGHYLSSSMTDDSRYVGNFGFESNRVIEEWRSYLSRLMGFSVRCVAR